MTSGGPKAQIKKALRTLGFELQRFDPEGSFAKRRQRLLEKERIGAVIDVGAHAGEFGQALRHGGYEGRIVSFEPLSEQHRRLRAVAEDDGRWAVAQTAVGDHPGETEIYISGNDGFSSSVRSMATVHEDADPGSSYIGSETVGIVTLDEQIDDLVNPNDRLMLKVDAQGYEAEVLAGAKAVLQHCHLVELELGLVELYEGQASFADLLDQMSGHGFVLTDVEPGFKNKQTAQLLQLDGLFTK